MEPTERKRGRPRGAVKPQEERRQRVDFRLSPATLILMQRSLLLAQERGIETRTDLVEAALTHYLHTLEETEIQASECEQLRRRVGELEQELALAQRTHEQQLYALQIKLTQLQAPTTNPSTRLPTSKASTKTNFPYYEIRLVHEVGPCPQLPRNLVEKLQYLDESICFDPLKCPAHHMFAQHCQIDVVRQYLEQLKSIPGMTRLVIDKNGYALPRDTWEKVGEHWERMG